MKLTFLGAAGEVTGSCTLVETGGTRFIVDCGLFQGGRDAWQKNASALTDLWPHLNFVVLTHAHLDHSGLCPRLYALGFRGAIFATPGTIDLCGVLLADSAHLMQTREQRGARRIRIGGSSVAAEPLYSVDDAQATQTLFRPIGYDTPVKLAEGIELTFRDAGHILGSAIAEFAVTERGRRTRLVFSGDLGQPGRPVVRDPTPISAADVLVVESTYGNRAHKSYATTLDELVDAVNDTFNVRRGNIVMPAFAVGRTQELLLILLDLTRQGRIGQVNVFVDSPMAVQATALTTRYASTLDPDAARALADLISGSDRSGLRVRFIRDVKESMALARIRSGALILSASGMCEGGRVQHHLRNNLPRPQSSVIFAGFQAAGTLGRRIVDGARLVSIHGERVSVRARTYTLGGLSAHADQPALLAWLAHFERPPAHTFVVHGEATSADAFASAVSQRFAWPVSVPAYRSSVLI